MVNVIVNLLEQEKQIFNAADAEVKVVSGSRVLSIKGVKKALPSRGLCNMEIHLGVSDSVTITVEEKES